MPSDAPQGLCPACLMALALGDEPAEPSSDDQGDLDRSTLHDEATLPPRVADPHAAATITRVATYDAPTEPTLEAVRALGNVKYFGDYELLSEIARGGMGVVYRARQVSLNRPVALKMILAGQLAGKDEVKRFHIEAEAAANLDHPAVVPIFEIGEHDGQHFFSMGFIEGTSLSARVADGPLPPREAATLTMQVAEAMQYAHERGVIHRDLKPANVLLDRQGRPKVTDFGLAKKLQGDSGLTHTGQVMGTPSYMPPEQAEGKDVGPLADVYSLGAILYCLLTGRPPFQAASPMDTLLQVVSQDPVPPRQLNPGVPRDLETITLKALEKLPGKRYQSAAALGADIDRWLRGEPILARPVGRLEMVAKWVRRRPVIAGLSMMVVVIGLVGLSGILWQWQRAERNFEESEKNRKLAEAQTAEAKAQRKIAETKTAEAQARADQLERQGYVSLIAISQRETQANNVALSDRLLDRCPPRLRGWEWRYCSRTNHSELEALRPLGRPYGVSLPSPDCRKFACHDGKLAWICDRQGKELCALGNHPDSIESLAWSADGKMVATGCRDRIIRLWDVESGAELGKLRGHGIWVTALAFSPDGTKLVSGAGAHPLVPGRRTEVRLWDLVARKEIHTLLNVNGGGTAAVAFAPDGKRLAAGTAGGGAHLWDVEKSEQIREFGPSPNQGTISSLRFSPDSRHLAAGSQSGGITLWDIEANSLVRSYSGHSGFMRQLRFSRDGLRLVSTGDDATIRLWHVPSGREQAILHGHTMPVLYLEFDPSETRLISSGYDGFIRSWDATIETRPAAITGHLGSTENMAFHPDGKSLASAGWGGIYLWDAASGRRFATIHTGHPSGRPSYVAYSEDGSQLAAVGESPLVQIWDTTSRKLIRSANLQTASCTTVAFSKDGSNLIIGDGRGYIRIWNITSATETASFLAHEEPICGMSFSPDGRRLVSATSGDVVKVWDLESHQELFRLKTVRSYGATESIAEFDHSGRRLAIMGQNNSVVIVDAKDGRVLRTLTGHSSQIHDMAFSPDGRRLATGGSDLTVRVWDTALGEEMITLRGRQGEVLSLGWSSDGRYLAAVGASEGQIWDGGPQGTMTSGQWGMAAEALAEAAAKDPDNLQLRYQQIDALGKAGNPDAVEAARKGIQTSFESKLAKDPKDMAAAAGLAQLYHLLGDQPALDKLLERHPAAATGVGDLYAADKNWERAIVEYTKAITPETKDAKLLAKRAEAYEKLERRDLAVSDWTRAWQQQPDVAFHRFKPVGAGSWQFRNGSGAAGSMEDVDGTLILTTTIATGTPWDVQAYQDQLQLENGAEYVIRFKMRSPDSHTVRLVGAINNGDHHVIGPDETIVPPSEFKDYEFTFVPHDIVPGNNRIGFDLGMNRGKVMVKEIVILKK
jgi:eukaryotic-like serine/threonine-protein kinase